MEPEQTKGWVAWVLAVAAMLSNPMGLAILLNIVVVNALELFDHLLPRKLLKEGTTDISLGMAAVLAWLIQPVAFGAICLGANWPVRGEMFVQGLVGGAIGSAVAAVLAHYGFSFDGLAERIKARREGPPQP